MVSCIVLSAGESRRFGSPKALAQVRQQPIIDTLCKRLKQSQIAETIIVLGAHKVLIEPYLLKHTGIRVVYNNCYKFGQTSSFQTGLQSVSTHSTGCMLLPVDCPFMTVDTLNQIVNDFLKSPQKILLPSYKCRKGHPPVFPAFLYNEILMLDHNTGLNVFIHEHQTRSRVVEYEDPGIVQTFNTPEELAQYKN